MYSTSFELTSSPFRKPNWGISMCHFLSMKMCIVTSFSRVIRLFDLVSIDTTAGRSNVAYEIDFRLQNPLQIISHLFM